MRRIICEGSSGVSSYFIRAGIEKLAKRISKKGEHPSSDMQIVVLKPDGDVVRVPLADQLVIGSVLDKIGKHSKDEPTAI